MNDKDVFHERNGKGIQPNYASRIEVYKCGKEANPLASVLRNNRNVSKDGLKDHSKGE